MDYLADLAKRPVVRPIEPEALRAALGGGCPPGVRTRSGSLHASPATRIPGSWPQPGRATSGSSSVEASR